MKKTLGKILHFLKPYRVPMGIALLLSAFGSLLTVVTPNLISQLITIMEEGLSGRIDLAAVREVSAAALLLLALGFVFSYIQGRLMATVTQKSAQSLRSSISRKIDRIPLSYFDRIPFGDTLSCMTNDVDTLTSALSNNISSVVTAAVTLIGCTVMMFTTNVLMAVCAIVSSLLGFFLVMGIMGKSQPFFTAQQNELGELNGQIEEVFTGHMVVKAFNCEGEVKENFAKGNEALYSHAWKAQFLSGMMTPIMGFVGNLGYVVVCIVGAVLALSGKAGMGDIVAFMLFVRLFSSPLTTLAQAGSSLQPALAAGERIFSLLEETEFTDTAGAELPAEQAKGRVAFQNVRFGYTPDRIIIGNFSAEIMPGQKVAIVGPTGAGKSTLVNLLMRFYELNGGSISIDGIPVTQMPRERLHHLLGMVLQETWVFEGTIRENIVYASENVSDAEVWEVIRAVGLEQYVKALPKGLDTVLNEQTSLSAGQKQLITIARAMVENAPVLILDEATSSIDTRTEKVIQNAIDRLTAGRTSFVIAHRLSTIRNADLIFYMEDGDVKEVGNHDALIAQSGKYAALYNSQFA